MSDLPPSKLIENVRHKSDAVSNVPTPLKNYYKTPPNRFRYNLFGWLSFLAITFLFMAGCGFILTVLDASNSYDNKSYAPYGKLTPTPIRAGTICLAENIFHEPLKVFGEGATVIGEIPVGDTVYITYEKDAVYDLLPDERFTGGYISARRVKLTCHDIDYSLPSD